MNNFYHIIAELSHSFLLIEIINCFQRNLLFQLTVFEIEEIIGSISSFKRFDEFIMTKYLPDELILF